MGGLRAPDCRGDERSRAYRHRRFSIHGTRAVAVDEPWLDACGLRIELDDRGIAIPEQRVGVDRRVARGDRGERTQELADAGVADVARDRDVRAIAEDLGDQARQHLTRSGLDEHARAGVVHRDDLVREPHRPGDLLGE